MLRIGTARADISPGPECSLIGYDFRHAHLGAGNDGVLDPLWCRVAVLDPGDGLAALVQLDSCIISVALARHLRQVVAEAIGTGPDRVLVGCSHSHSTPWLQESELSYDLGSVLPHTSEWPDSKPGQQYTLQMVETLRRTAVRAAAYTVPMALQVREAALGLGYCRRVDTPYGLQQCWGPAEQDELNPSPQADPWLTLGQFRQVGGDKRFLLWSHGTHPVVLGKTSTKVSADWPGVVASHIEQLYPDAESCFMLGACGDTHPWLATQPDASAVGTVGRAAAAQVELLSAVGGSLDPNPQLQVRTSTITLGGRELDCSAWRLGTLTMVSSPTELFADLSCQLRERIDGPLIVATNANGWTGYWPTQGAFASGGYEIDAAKAMGRSVGDGERLVDALVDLAESLESV